jgi:hypothetical protein
MMYTELVKLLTQTMTHSNKPVAADLYVTSIWHYLIKSDVFQLMCPTVIRVLVVYIHIHTYINTHTYRAVSDVLAKLRQQMSNYMSSRQSCRVKRKLNLALNKRKYFQLIFIIIILNT